jgi:uncharacterized membrane protein
MEYLLLVFLHVAFGVLWAGGAILVGLFVIPSVLEAGPAAGAVMAGIVKRRMPLVLSFAGVVTVLSGLRIYMVRFSTEWLQTPEGIAITVGALLGLDALMLGLFVQRPTAGKIGALAARIAQAGAPTAEQKAEMQTLQRRLRVMGAFVAWNLVGATLLMASHRLLTAF